MHVDYTLNGERDDSEMLSKHISRARFEYSDTAKRKNIRNRMSPRQVLIARDFCREVIDPLVDYFGFMPTLACYRSARLADVVGSGLGSHHRMRRSHSACDIEFVGVPNYALAVIAGILVPYDQLILELHDGKKEMNSGWVHIGWKQDPAKNRYQHLTYRGGGRYVAGIH